MSEEGNQEYDITKDPKFESLFREHDPVKLPEVDATGKPVEKKNYGYAQSGFGSWANLVKVDPCGH